MRVTLRYLGTGGAQVTIGASYRMSPTTVNRIINEACSVIWNLLLQDECIKPLSTEREWKKGALKFERR